MIVVDTNILVCLRLPGPLTASCDRLVSADPDWVAPRLWRSEFRNVLVLHLRKGLLDMSEALRAMASAEAQMAETTLDVPSDLVLRLSSESGCTAYDCEFVALAHELETPLFTTDRQILRAFPDLARPLPSSP